MKQKIPIPAVVALVIVVLGGLGFFAWKQVASSSDDKPFVPKMGNPGSPPHTREEGMKMYRGGH
jgi:hypothetical protein